MKTAIITNFILFLVGQTDNGVSAFTSGGVSVSVVTRSESYSLLKSSVREESSTPAASSSDERDSSFPDLDSNDVSEAREKLLLREEEKSLPPLLQNMVTERRSFEINLGRAMDTLRRDYPDMLRREPNFEIYSKEISVVDPSGVQIKGLNTYKSSFKFLQTFIKLLYQVDRSTIQHRMVYDWARSSIRISWNAELISKVSIGGGKQNALYIDGISVYKIGACGKIVEHKVDKLMINNTPLKPPYGVFEALRSGVQLGGSPATVPVGVGAMFGHI